MVNVKNFTTDAVAVAGVGADVLTALLFWRPLRDIIITDLIQAPGAVLANDADWQIFADGKATDYLFYAEELDPGNVGRIKLEPDGIKVKAGTTLQFNWLGQGAAQANILKVLYR
jgi:hypothetical protein